jgi:hypothetical protein
MLPYKFKLPGYVLIITGIVFSVLYFTVKFRFEIPVFAVASSYLKTKYFTTFSTNFSDESICILLLAGFSLVVFSRERNESALMQQLRMKALSRAVLADIVFLLFTVIFIYGSGFLVATILNLFLPFIFYIIIFNMMKTKASGAE